MDHVEKELLGVRARIESLLGRSPDQKESARRRGALHERLARSAPSQLVASMQWKQAAEEYLQVGIREEGARAKAAAREAIQRAEDEGEFEQIGTPIQVTDDQVEQMVRPFIEGTDAASVVLRRMATRLFVASLESGAGAPRTRSIVSQILVTVPVVDDRSLAEVAPDTDEQARFEERRALLLEINLTSAMLISELFKRLREVFHLHEDDLVAHIAASPFVEPQDLPFVRVAVERYLRGDLLSALHVLVPRVEQMLRRLLRAAGTEITALRDGELRERPLGELLRAGESDGVLPTPLARLLQAVLSEDWGLNLRNRVAHGLVKPEDCTQPHVDRVLHIALLVAQIRLEEQAPPADQEIAAS